MSTNYKYRSWLCSNDFKNNLIDNSAKFQADITHFDLEDSVPLKRKKEAREQLPKKILMAGKRKVAVRINRVSSIEGMKDILALKEMKVLPDILILPKAKIPYDIQVVHKILNTHNKLEIFAVVESAECVRSLQFLTNVPKSLRGVIFGSADYAADIKVNLKEANLSSVKYQIVSFAKSMNIIAIDTPCFSLDDESQMLEKELIEAKGLGFDGKIAIHPKQISSINKAFGISHQEINESKQIIKALKRDDSISIVGNNLVGPPFLKYANKLLEEVVS